MQIRTLFGLTTMRQLDAHGVGTLTGTMLYIGSRRLSSFFSSGLSVTGTWRGDCTTGSTPSSTTRWYFLRTFMFHGKLAEDLLLAEWYVLPYWEKVLIFQFHILQCEVTEKWYAVLVDNDNLGLVRNIVFRICDVSAYYPVDSWLSHCTFSGHLLAAVLA